MQVWWGKKSFSANAAEVVSDFTTSLYSDLGYPLRYLCRYDVTAWIDGDGQAALSTEETAFIAALATPRQNFRLAQDSGADTGSCVYDANTLSGTRVTGWSFPEGKGAEYVNRRTIRFSVEAEIAAPTAANLVSFTESVQITGNGGPRDMWRFPINTIGIKQRITPNSLVRAVQSGRSVGHLSRPGPRAYLFPAALLMNETVMTGTESPRMLGRVNVEYPRTWAYVFESNAPLVGFAASPVGI